MRGKEKYIWYMIFKISLKISDLKILIERMGMNVWSDFIGMVL